VRTTAKKKFEVAAARKRTRSVADRVATELDAVVRRPRHGPSAPCRGGHAAGAAARRRRGSRPPARPPALLTAPGGSIAGALRNSSGRAVPPLHATEPAAAQPGLEGTVTRVEFHDHGDTTRMTLSDGPYPLKEGAHAEAGWNAALDKLGALLA
jgi:activator of Hsp90 ATPase-like protein